MKKIILSGIVLGLLSALPVQAITSQEIIKKSQDITRSKTSQGTMEMLIVKPKYQRKMHHQ